MLIVSQSVYMYHYISSGRSIKPTLSEVYRILKGKSANWNAIGEALGVSYNDRQGISHDLLIPTKEGKLEAVLNLWIQEQCSEVSWNHLYDIIKNELHYNDTAVEIKKIVSLSDETIGMLI